MQNWTQILDYALQHMLLSVFPIILGTLIAVPLARVANQRRLTRSSMYVVSSVLYAIPSLPLLIFLPALLGTKILNPVNIEVALTIYAIAIMLTSASHALLSIDPSVMHAADAMGFGAWGKFFQVELPLSGSQLLAGIRVVSVSTISLITVGSLIGVNSLGFFFIEGYQRDFPLEIWVGIAATALIALLFDQILAFCGRALMPWNHHRETARDGVAA
ncbi:ABC transporter permease [Bifidobacterium aquikefiricola]|uniref:ABC transporter permease subunit n=1 Tax=Bifidobacterium aquikefiricola TaxID=3059038 RepID=A0AB39U669_9BIFI